MKQNIIVIDDFHHNAEEVRQFALNAGYPPPVTDTHILVEILKEHIIQKNYTRNLKMY